MQQPEYAPLLPRRVATRAARAADDIVDEVLVRFGREILKVVPGRASTEVDARLPVSADLEAASASPDHGRCTSRRAGATGTSADQDRSTGEGIRRARAGADGIHCNLTLLFSFCQAVACGDGGVRS